MKPIGTVQFRRWMRVAATLCGVALLTFLVAAALLARLPVASGDTSGTSLLQEHSPRWVAASRSAFLASPTPLLSPTVALPPPLLTVPVRPDTLLYPAPQYPGLRAAWLADLTVEDGSLFAWGEVFTKTWRLVNVGAEAWPADTRLDFVRGEVLGGRPASVGAVLPGAAVEVSVRLSAPKRSGFFSSAWSLMTGDAIIPGSEVWVVIEAEPPPSLTELAPIRGAFELGGHVSQGLVHAARMQQMGMRWVKVQARYGEGGDLRPFISAAHAQGFKVLISAVGAPTMVTEANFSRRVADWLAGIAAAGADAIEVWNEPNLPREWRQGYISPRAYTNLLCASYTAIKRANRGTLVISAAPAPTGYFNGCTVNGCDDAPWMEGLVAAGAARCFDYLGAHHNAGATAPSARTGHPADREGNHHSWYFLPQTELYYEQFAGKRQLFYTELGYLSADGFGWIPDGFSWAGNISTGMQAAWLAEVAKLGRETGMVRAIVIWNVDATCYGDCGSAEDPQGGYAMIRPSGACPACEALEALQKP